jgi:hypothetical protein
LRAEFCERAALFVTARLKFIDEAGFNMALTRLYGRASGGKRVHEAVPKNYGKNITMLAALGVDGISAPMTIQGAVDSEVFLAYLNEVLVPTLKPDDIAVMDNLCVHKVSRVQEIIKERGARLEYLPPY